MPALSALNLCWSGRHSLKRIIAKMYIGKVKRGMFRVNRRVSALHLMMLPPVVLLFIYSYIPMAGVVIAFQNYIPSLGFLKSHFVGFDNFRTLFLDPAFKHVLFNTVYISLLKIVTGLFFQLVFALMLNEVRRAAFKRTIQTVIYLPYFVSWVIMAGIIIDILSPTNGLLNNILGNFGVEPIFFLGNNTLFPYIMVITNIWKEFGWGTIIFLSALSSIDTVHYEAAVIDGAGRWKQMLHVTLPGVATTVVLVATLSLGNILNAGFEQIFNLLSPMTLQSGDIIDTLVYRYGIQNAQFGLATAAGLFKSGVSCLLIILSYRLAYRFTGYRII